MNNIKVENRHLFPNVAFEQQVFPLTFSSQDMNWVALSNPESPLYTPLFAPGMFQTLYKKYYESEPNHSIPGACDMGMGSADALIGQSSFPIRNPRFGFFDANGNEVMNYRQAALQVPYYDVMEMLKKQCMMIRNLRYSYVVETSPGNASCLGTVRSLAINFFTQNVFGNMEVNGVPIISMINPKDSFASKDAGTSGGWDLQTDVIDLPVNFVLSSSSGIALPMVIAPGGNSRIKSWELTLVVSKATDNCVKKSVETI